MAVSNQNLNNLKYSTLKICRLCESDKNLTELFTGDRNILRKTKALIDCTITVNDELPKYICLRCADGVESYYNFKTQCEFTDYKLRKRITEHTGNDTVYYDDTDIQPEYYEEIDDTEEMDMEKDENTIEYDLNCRYDALDESETTTDERLLTNAAGHFIDSECNEKICNVEQQNDDNIDTVYNPDGDRNEAVQDDIDEMAGMNGETDEIQVEYLDADFDDSYCEDFDSPSKADDDQLNSPTDENHPNDLLNECVQDSNSCLQPAESIEIIIQNSEIANIVSPQSGDDDCNKITQIEHKRDKFVCDTCGKKFNKFTDYSEHNKTHGKQRYQCEVCNKWFLKRYHLRNHKNIHDQNNKRYACDLCTKNYSSQGNLDRHKRVYHQKHKAYFCDICGRGFSQSNILRTHLSVHVSEKQYQCSVCQKSYKTESHLKRHNMCHVASSANQLYINYRNRQMMNNHQHHRHNLQNITTTKRKPQIKTYVCTECGKKSNSVALHLGHMRTHTGEQPFECDVCSKRFSFAQSLSTHKLLHTGAKPYKCNVCGVRFRQIGHLLGHKLVHTGEKRHKCLICGKPFALRGNLNVHMRLHTGETPYHCNGCDKKFSDANNLKRHILIHEKQKNNPLVVINGNYNNNNKNQNCDSLVAQQKEYIYFIDELTNNIDAK